MVVFVYFAAEELDLGARNCLFSTNFINEALTLPCSRTKFASLRVRSIPDRYYPNDSITGHLCYGEVVDDCASLGRKLFLLDPYDWAPEADKGRTCVSNLILLGM